MSDDEEPPGDDDLAQRWSPVTGPLAPARAAALAAALEQAGIEVAFVEPEERVFPTQFSATPSGAQLLAVPEEQVARARETIARVSSAFPAEPSPLASFVADEPSVPGVPLETPRSFPPSDEERAFEALRVRRYTQGLLIFVVGMIWVLAALPRVQQDALMAVLGALVLCAGLFRIYSALSLRKGAEDDDAESGDADE